MTAGESHGKGLLGIIEGLPSGFEIELEYLLHHMKRRKMGYGRGRRMQIEDDSVEIISGIRHGKSIGSPIGLIVWNKDWKNWENIMQSEPYEGEVKRKVEIPRPGHADLVGGIKYQHKDMRNVLERSSARETAMRVALGSVARRFLEAIDIHIASRVIQLGKVQDNSQLNTSIQELNQKVDLSAVRCLSKSAEESMIEVIDQAKEQGDTLGGIFEVYASGLPVGLGSYSRWDRRLEGHIGHSFMSMNAFKGVEIGLGFQLGKILGSEAHDEFFPGETPLQVNYKSNRSGGITGGMSTGQPIVVRAAMKPISTLMKPLNSVNLSDGEAIKAHVERSDTCAVPAAAVIGEALLALVLAESILEKFGGDSMAELIPRIKNWQDWTKPTDSGGVY